MSDGNYEFRIAGKIHGYSADTICDRIRKLLEVEHIKYTEFCVCPNKDLEQEE